MIQEALQGDPGAVARRIAAIERFAVLEVTAEAEELAATYLRTIPLLQSAIRDALHLAIASASGVDYLATWNCARIACAQVKQAIRHQSDALGLDTPTICTPEEMLGE